MERPGEHGDDNAIGYRNVDEEADHDESGSQGAGRRELPADEQETGGEPDGIAQGG